MEQKIELFSNKALKAMIVPLFLEQLLTASVLLSVVISAVVIIANESLMRLLFGKVDVQHWYLVRLRRYRAFFLIIGLKYFSIAHKFWNIFMDNSISFLHHIISRKYIFRIVIFNFF